MARHGENIRRRKDGRWEGRYPVYSEEKGKQIYRSVYAGTYIEVREKLAVQKNRLKNPPKGTLHETGIRRRPDSNDIMLAEAAQEWLTGVKEKRKQSTYVKYRMILHKHIENNFRDIFLSEVTSALVRERVPDLLSDSVRRSIYCVLNQILKFASERYSIMVPELKKTASDGRSKPVKTLAQSEQRKLIAVLYREMDIFKMAVLLCLSTGLRLGELCALKWTDVDFESQILMVGRTVQRLYADGKETKTVLLETAPKSVYSQREIPLPDTVLALLTRFRNGREYIFGGDRPMEPRTMQYHFKKMLKEAEVPDINFHALRHTFSTNCIEDGTDVKSLSEILGHADVQITLNRYVHPSMEIKRRYMDSLSKFYGQIYGQVS